MQERLAELKATLSEEQVVCSEEAKATYGRDWTFHFTPSPLAVVFPKSTDEVVRIVQWAREHHHPLVPSGGRTGCSGGALATENEVVVSFEKMNRILSFDAVDRSVTAQAGVVTQSICAYANERGLIYPVTFSAIGSSQIGGNVATNAGGSFVVRYGLTRDWVRGLTVVTGTGEVLELNNGLVKNATGYDLRHLFIGSEGTLGFITEVTLGLAVPPKELTTVLLAVPDYRAVLELYRESSSLFSLRAIEVFDDTALELVLTNTDLRPPFSEVPGLTVLLELECSSESEKLLSFFEHLMEQEIILDSALSQNESQRATFWAYRERVPEVLAHYKPYKNDISVRTSKIPEFVAELQSVLKDEYQAFTLTIFGHVGDGNLHVNILKPEEMSDNEFLAKCSSVNASVFSLVQRLGGSVSAEHGVGITKKDYLEYTRSKEEIDLMRDVKRVFDPDGILNPGKIF